MNLAGIDLENFYWKDRFKFKPVAQSAERSGNGVLVIDQMILSYGQPIELQGGLITYSELTPLIALEEQPSEKRIFTDLDGTEYAVLLDFERGGVVPNPTFEVSNPNHTKYRVSIFLITVEPDAPAEDGGE